MRFPSLHLPKSHPIPSMVRVRAFTPSDAEALAAIYAPYVTDTFVSFEEDPPSPEVMAQRAAAVLDRGFPFLVAETEQAVDGAEGAAGARVLGFAYVSEFGERVAYRFTVEDSIYVANDAHGRGVGRALFEALTARCRELGLRVLVARASTTPGVAARTRPRCGFTSAWAWRSVGRFRASGSSLVSGQTSCTCRCRSDLSGTSRNAAPGPPQ